MKYLLGVDLGTTAVKVGLFDSQARKICSSTQEYRLITESHFVVEQEVSVYWDAFKAGLRRFWRSRACPARNSRPERLRAGETMVFLDEAGRPLSRHRLDGQPRAGGGPVPRGPLRPG
ncbi:MAG: FGGY family carbohydrate kinase [Anaerotruncus massiliensis (ex Togo et al. 2019)]